MQNQCPAFIKLFISLQKNFAPMLTHLIKLDLSKNQLTELPENFGELVNLRHLDLYSNQVLVA
jgi:Leucine-rich repeat (LRR) protein